MTKLERIEEYLYNFLEHNIFEFDIFYKTTYDQRQEGIFKLKDGNLLMDFLNDVYCNINEKLRYSKLVPDRFTTPDHLLNYLQNFKEYFNDKSHLLDESNVTEETSYIITHFIEYKNKIVSAIDYALEIYDLEDENLLLYQQLRYHLIKEDIDSFINDLKSIFSSVSYAIARKSEGYYHANVYLILKLLGFDIITEDTTNIGRIDAVIKFSNKIYILEFKFSKQTDDSQEAINQIKNMDYALKYRIDSKAIYGLGISFTEDKRNINSYKFERL